MTVVDEITAHVEHRHVRDTTAEVRTADTFRHREGGLVVVEDLLDRLRIAALTFGGDENHSLLRVLLMHLDQMRHSSDTRASPGAPVFDDNDFAFQLVEFDFFGKLQLR